MGNSLRESIFCLTNLTLFYDILYLIQILGGGQPDSDMKVDFGEIGIGKIGKIGISDFFTPKFVFFADFGEIGNKKFFEFPIFKPQNSFFGKFWPHRERKKFWNIRFLTQNPPHLSEYLFLS